MFSNLRAVERTQGGYREIWKVAYPLILTNASQIVMQFVDRKFLATNSTDDMAAAFPAGILCFTFCIFFMATTGFTNAIVSQYNGLGDKESCARAPWAGFYFAVAAGLICSYLLPYPGFWLIEAAGHAPEIMHREKEYFEILMPSGGFMFIGVAFCAFFSGRGKTWYVAIIHLLACSLNIVLDYILIFGKFGAPALGISGAAIGTTISCVFAAILSFVFFISQKEYPTWACRRPEFSHIKRLLQFGGPTGVEVLFSVGAFTLIAFLVGQLGRAALAANTMATSINMLSFMPLLGMSEATSIIVGRYIGKGLPKVSEKAAYRALKMSLCYMALMSTLYLLFPDDLFGMFTPAHGGGADFVEALGYGRAVLACAALFNMFNAVRFIFLGALNGAGDTKVPMLIVIGCAWGILAPGGIIIILVLKLTIVAIWIFISLHIFVLSSLILWRFRSGAWKKINMIDRKRSVPETLELETATDVPHP